MTIAPAFTPPFYFQHNAKTLYLWWLCHRDHNCLRAVAVRGTLNLLQKYEGQFGRSLLQFTIANTKEVVHQIVSSGLTPVMIRCHQDNLIDFCDFCRLHTHCRVKNHWQLFERALKKPAQSNDIFFTSYEDLVSPKLSTVCLTEGKHGSILPQIIALLIFKGAEVSDTIDYGLRYIQNRDLGDHRLRITTRHGVRSLRLSDREEELLKQLVGENEDKVGCYLIHGCRRVQNQTIKRWAINHKLCQLAADFYGDQELMSYRTIRRSGMMYWLTERAQERFGAVRGLLVDQRNALIDELMATWDFTVAATNGRVTIQRVWDQYLASTKHGITGE